MLTITQQFDMRRVVPSDIWEHMDYLFASACAVPAPKIIELGTRTGNSTVAFLAAIDHLKGGHLWSVDVDAPRTPPAWGDIEAWTFTRGDDTAPEIVAWHQEHAAPVDLLFVDTSHTYKHTLDELRLWVPMVRPGGVVLMHDTEWERKEVAQALNEFCPANGLTWVNHPGCNGIGEIRIPEAHVSLG